MDAKFSNRARKALEILVDGGRFEYRLERDGYTGFEKFRYRLKTEKGSIVKGIGHSTFYELERAGYLAARYEAATSISTPYYLRKA